MASSMLDPRTRPAGERLRARSSVLDPALPPPLPMTVREKLEEPLTVKESLEDLVDAGHRLLVDRLDLLGIQFEERLRHDLRQLGVAVVCWTLALAAYLTLVSGAVLLCARWLPLWGALCVCGAAQAVAVGVLFALRRTVQDVPPVAGVARRSGVS